MPDPTPVPGWRTIDELARCVGGYCWQEHRLFGLTGGWAGGVGSAEVRVFFSEVSARHAFFARQWRDRLPARAGVDVPALIAPPSGPVGPALGRLEGAAGPLPRLAGLVAVLPRLHAIYATHLALASPVNEAPVMAVLRLVAGSHQRELRRGQALLEPALALPDHRGEVTEVSRDLERFFAEDADKVPAARPS